MPRITYTSIDQIKSKLPFDFMVDSLDDNRDGMIDDDVWQAVAEDAAVTIDGQLGQRYAVPFDISDLPAIVRDASKTLILETLYIRRGYADREKNPFRDAADRIRKTLAAIGNGDIPLTPDSIKPLPSVMAITGQARTASATGRMSV